MSLDLSTYKPVVNASGDANQIANGFQAIQDYVNGIKPRYVTTSAFALLSPADGDEVYLIVDATNGVIWHLRYNAGSASAYKWEFLGGPSMFAEVATQETTSGTAYGALATAGPSLTLPRPGDYDVAIGARVRDSSSNTTQNALMSYDIGGAAAVDADSVSTVVLSASTAAIGWNTVRPRRKTALTAVALTAKYKAATASPVEFAQRWMIVMPVRLS